MLRRNLYGLALLICVIVALGGALTPAQAQESVSDIQIIRVTCSNVTVRYTLNVTTGIEAILLVEDAGGTYIGAATGPSEAGTYVTNIPLYGTEPDGTRMRVEINYDNGFFFSGYVTCSTSGATGGGGDEPTPVPWDGFTDGRINADPAEYYSIFCAFREVRIYRSTPSTELLRQIPILSITGLGVGQELDLGGFMTLVRNTEDTITVYGSNGNLAPEPGSKAFSLSECTDSLELVDTVLDSSEAIAEVTAEADAGSGAGATPTPDPFADVETLAFTINVDPCSQFTGFTWANCAYNELDDQGFIPLGSGLPTYLLLLAFSCLLPAGGLVFSPLTFSWVMRYRNRRKKP